jgi:hypothetical protein
MQSVMQMDAGDTAVFGHNATPARGATLLAVGRAFRRSHRFAGGQYYHINIRSGGAPSQYVCPVQGGVLLLSKVETNPP